ncbi:Protein CBG02096 [Caenorhabditis briggsae]|uniref:Protein kinase domain-containing protein n=2 Tax=Caenorhabditis briggsae TaxID=6238 RepID=A0AAE8ZNM2_CAEBR|nr:Protein CBG02096 [Caenorhabditis briggsae]ULT80675.1 hypothetical protein L3Y34_010908 [Caenorhabditis briggsae]CAP23250.2 Protein CBG02096 [Caenorhabditis briggsae]
MSTLSTSEPNAQNLVMGTAPESGELPAGRFGTIFLGFMGNSLLPITVKKYNGVRREKGRGVSITKNLSIRHPEAPTNYSVEKLTNLVQIVLEEPKKSLHDDIAFHTMYYDEQIKIVTCQVVKALDYLLTQNISHGFLHTKNIFIDKYQLVKITDEQSDDSLHDDMSVQNIQFIAPELAAQEYTITPECDIWSLGVIMFVMATGCTPFNGETFEIFMCNIQNGSYQLPVKCSDKVRELIQNMIKVDASERLKLVDLVKDEWIEMCSFWPCLVNFDECIQLNLVKKPKSAGGFMDGHKLGFLSKLALTSSQHEVEMEKKSEQPEKEILLVPPKPLYPKSEYWLPNKYNVTFNVFAVENNREEWDPNVTRIEKCKMSGGLVCIRVVIPALEDPEPELAERAQEVVVGDYALLDFKRDGTTIAKTGCIAQFKNRREATDHFCRIEAERIWNHLDMSVCGRCRRAGTDAGSHEKETCLYKIFADAVETKEVIFCHQDDRYHIKSFNLEFRRDGGRVSHLKRIQRHANKIVTTVASGCQKLVSRIRRRRIQN